MIEAGLAEVRARILHAVFAINDCGVYVRIGMFCALSPLSVKYTVCVRVCALSLNMVCVCACALSVKYMVCVRVRVLSLSFLSEYCVRVLSLSCLCKYCVC